MQKPFKLLSGDVSGIPAIYYRPTSPQYDAFDIYEVNEWADMDSSAIETHGKYNVQSGTVALDNQDNNARALTSWGLSMTVDGIEDSEGAIIAPANKVLQMNRIIAECLWSYGSKDVALDVSGNNLRKLVKQARNAL